MCRVLAKISEDKVCGALVVLKWVSASFWPLLCQDGTHFDQFVKGVVYLPQHRKNFIRVVKAMIQCLGTLI